MQQIIEKFCTIIFQMMLYHIKAETPTSDKHNNKPTSRVQRRLMRTEARYDDNFDVNSRKVELPAEILWDSSIREGRIAGCSRITIYKTSHHYLFDVRLREKEPPLSHGS